MANILANSAFAVTLTELEKLGLTATKEELNYVEGARSNIQQQIDDIGASTISDDYDLVLLASNWVGEEAPYTYDLTFADHTNTKDKIAIMAGDDATAEEVTALQSINIAVANWVNETTLQLKAYCEDKAEIDIPINLTISSISMKFADDSSMLVFRDMVVPIMAWKEDFTYVAEGFGYSADIVCEHVTEEYMPEVTFGVSDSACGNFSSNAATFENVVRIYAKEIPSGNITIPTITCTIAAARLIGGSHHADSHAKNGTDPITPEMIGAYGKSEVIADETKVLMGLEATATPDDAFKYLMENGGSGGTAMDLLWENASLESAFAAQTVKINYSPYRFLLFDMMVGVGYPQRFSVIISTNGTCGRLMMTSNKFYLRDLEIISDGISFSDNGSISSFNGSQTLENNVNVPVAIYGIK